MSKIRSKHMYEKIADVVNFGDLGHFQQTEY